MPALPTTPGGPPTADPERTPGPSSALLAATPVYPLIHQIRKDVIAHIDTPLTWEQLHAPDTTYTVVRPLTEKYLGKRNHAVVFCLLINRVQFIRLSSISLSLSLLSLSRAALCELLAIRLLRAWSERTLELAHVLLTPWDLYQGASDVVRQRLEDEGEEGVERVGNALEMAIISKSKRFIKSPSCQKVINGIWTGRVIYQAASVHAIIADNYKTKPIGLYNPHKAPLLDHYRLRVPRVRAVLELTNFLILFGLFVLTLELGEIERVNIWEWGFIVYAAGFSLDKVAATQEHGMQVYSANLWNGFDLAFVVIYLAYLSLRGWGLAHILGGGGESRKWAAVLGVDLLAIGACVMFPRLAFVSLSDNLMILALRSMVAEFAFLMMIGAFCFLGFLYALYTLSEKSIPIGTVSWWMLDIFFGLDASGFNQATKFHPFFGPVVMVTYACLSNTLILTVLVAILSKTFADISQDAAAEAMFRKAVSTIEGVKSDAVFSYQAPFNLIAVLVMVPLKLFLGPRYFHKVNVLMIRASAFPILICISLYERQVVQRSHLVAKLGDWFEYAFETLPRGLQSLPLIEGLVGSSSEISNVFEIEDEINQDWSESDTDTDGFDSDSDLEAGLGDEGKPADMATLDHPVFSPGQLSPAQMSPQTEQPPALTVEGNPPLLDAGIGAEQPRQRVNFPPTVDKTLPSVGIPHSPRKRLDSLDGYSRAKPSPLAQIYSSKLSASHQQTGHLSSAGGRGIHHRRAASSSAHDGIAHRRAFSQSNSGTGAGRQLPRTMTIPEGRVAFERSPSPAPPRPGSSDSPVMVAGGQSLPAPSSSNLAQRLAQAQDALAGVNSSPSSQPIAIGLTSDANPSTSPTVAIGKASDLLETGDVDSSQMAARVRAVEKRMGRMEDLLSRILERLPPPDSRRGSTDARGHDDADDEQLAAPLNPLVF